MGVPVDIEGLLLGQSLPIRQLRALVARAAETTLPVLVEGPTGSGKELVAQALHAASGRAGNLVPFNVCALADGMFEDALFGHVRGAFTGALSDRTGFLDEAHGGTLFLDEIGGLGLAAQAKLLRAIETGIYRPVGARSDRRSEFRVVAASNVPVSRLVTAGSFRADLSYRLAGITITMPPLRNRREDVPILARHFLGRLDPEGNHRLSEPALTALAAHDWPGNVRELRHAIERAVLFSTTPVVGRESVEAALWRAKSSVPSASRREFTDRRLVAELEAASWDIHSVASALGVHRATVYRRIKRLGIGPDSWVRDPPVAHRGSLAARHDDSAGPRGTEVCG